MSPRVNRSPHPRGPRAPRGRTGAAISLPPRGKEAFAPPGSALVGSLPCSRLQPHRLPATAFEFVESAARDRHHAPDVDPEEFEAIQR